MSIFFCYDTTHTKTDKNAQHYTNDDVYIIHIVDIKSFKHVSGTVARVFFFVHFYRAGLAV